MTSLAKYFNIDEDANLKGITHKNNIIKRNIIAYMAINGESTLSELTRELHISVPTMTKLVQELVDDSIDSKTRRRMNIKLTRDILTVGYYCVGRYTQYICYFFIA